MNLNRLRWGEWIAAIAALDLLVVTFRAWYKVTGSGAHVTAWDALDKGRYLLIATAVVGIFLWLIKAGEDTRQLSFEPGWIAAVVGFICTVYIAYRLASPPSDALDPTIGIYLGLLSALGVTIGGLLSARETAAAAGAPGRLAVAGAGAGGATGPLTADTSPTWSPAAPAASTTGWSPATPAVAVPPATAAGAALGGGGGSENAVRPGDHVVLTAGGTRFPAGTVAQVIEAFEGGALVEVKAADGMAERFEVPKQAYERAPAGGTGQPARGQDWSPALPAAAGNDWGFGDAANGAAAHDATANGTALDESQAEKVPWWKREIGGGKKKKGEEALALGGAAAAGAAAVKLADGNGSSEEKTGFFKRMFGGGKDAEPETEALDMHAPDDAPGEPPTESAVDEAPSTSASEAATTEPESDPNAESAGAMGAAGAGSTPSEPETTAASEPNAESPSEAAGASLSTTEPEPSPSEPAASEAGASDPAVSEDAPGIGGAGVAAAGAGAAAAAAASARGAGRDEEDEQPRRKPSSGSRNIPAEALSAAAVEEQPKVGDEVQLKVGGGKFDAGSRGTVVDVFSAGVIVELNSGDGRTERVDLPFEAIGPAGT